MALPIRESFSAPRHCARQSARRSSFKIPHIFHEAKAGPAQGKLRTRLNPTALSAKRASVLMTFWDIRPGRLNKRPFRPSYTCFFPQNYYIAKAIIAWKMNALFLNDLNLAKNQERVYFYKSSIYLIVYSL